MTNMNVIDTRLPELLRGTRALLGMFVGIPSPSLVEMCGHAGVDFVIVDNEHGPAGIESTEHMLRAARASGVIPVVRTLEADILRVLDIGASAIQVPQVNSAEQARRIVAAAKYPPLGMRGAAFSTRAAGYGFFGGDRHVADSNAGTAVIVMTETREPRSRISTTSCGARHRRGVLRTERPVVFVRPSRARWVTRTSSPPSSTASSARSRTVLRRACSRSRRTTSIAGARKGCRYLPMVLSGLLGNALRTTVAAARNGVGARNSARLGSERITSSAR